MMSQDAMPIPARNILILGGSGFIGSNLSSALSRIGHCVYAASRKVTSPDASPADGNIQRIDLDMYDVEYLKDIVQRHAISMVIHLASSLKPSSTEEEYFTERDRITTPTMHLAHFLAQRKVVLVYFSSGGTVYGAATAGEVSENTACLPISYYGQSKLEIESQLLFLHRSMGLRYLIVRPSNPFGPNQSTEGTQGLVSVTLGKIMNGQALEVWGDGSNVRDYIYIDDLTSSVCKAISVGVENTILNIGSGTGHSLIEVVQTIEQVTGKDVPLVFHPSRRVDVPRLVLDVDHARKLGLYFSRSLSSGVRTYSDYLGITYE